MVRLLGGFHVDWGLKVGVLLNLGLGSLRKCHLGCILRQNSLKSRLSSGSLILFWIGE